MGKYVRTLHGEEFNKNVIKNIDGLGIVNSSNTNWFKFIDWKVCSN